MKLKDISNPNFDQAMADLAGKELDVKTAFLLAEIVDQVREHQKHVDKVRKQLIDRHAKKGEDGKPAVSEDGSMYLFDDLEAFNKEFTELMEVEVSVKTIPRAAIDKLSSISAKTVLNLKAIIS